MTVPSPSADKAEQARPTIVIPDASDDQISNDLVWLTELLVTNNLGDPEYVGGILGGTYGYGTPYENDTFMLHPYCWCERADCDWCLGCECPETAWTYRLADGTVVDGEAFYDAGGYRTGTAEHKPECDYCTGRRAREPNFRHKASGTTVSWYKYIGRGMEVDVRGGDWRAVVADCVESVRRSGGVS